MESSAHTVDTHELALSVIGQLPPTDVLPQWSTLFAASQDCLKIIGLDGRLLAMNHHGACMMELGSPDTVIGQDWPMLWPASMRPVVADAVRRAASGRLAVFSGACSTARGRWFQWRVIVVPLRDAFGQVQSLLASSHPLGRTSPVQTDDEAVPAPTLDRIYGQDGGLVLLASPCPALAGRLESVLAPRDYTLVQVRQGRELAGLVDRLVPDTLIVDDDGLAADLALPSPTSVIRLSRHACARPAPAPRCISLPSACSDEELLRAVRLASLAHRSARQFSQWASGLDELRRRIRRPRIHQVLDLWCGLRRQHGQIPDADQCDDLVRQATAVSFIASVDAGVTPPQFTFEWVGSELERLAGIPLEGQSVTTLQQPVLGALHAPYERALCGLPCLDWARIRLGGGRSFMFERLILPLTTDGFHVTHLVGIVEIESKLWPN